MSNVDPLKRVGLALLALLLAFQLTGCAAAWFGAGAATGAAIEDELEENDDER